MPDDKLKKLADAFGVKPEAPAKPTGSGKTAKGDASVGRVIDEELSNLGYGGTSRLSILGDVGRENGYNRNIIFGGHADPKNQEFNRGIISWQKDRRTKLDAYLKKQGVHGKADDNELRGMVRFMDDEMKRDYPDVYNRVRNAKTTAEASRAMLDYIKYVPGGEYNSPDENFVTKNNAQWAEWAQSQGFAKDRPSLDGLANAFGAGRPQGDLAGLESSFGSDIPQKQPGTLGPTNPQGPVFQPQAAPPPMAGDLMPSANDPVGALTAQRAQMDSERRRLSDELTRAKTPARRNAILTQIKAVNDGMLKIEQTIRAEKNKQQVAVPATAPAPLTPQKEEYVKREIKPGDQYYEFEKTGRLKDTGDEYLGAVSGKHRFRDKHNDEYEIEGDKQRYVKERSTIRDKEGAAFFLGDQTDVPEGTVRRYKTNVHTGKVTTYLFDKDGAYREENPKLRFQSPSGDEIVEDEDQTGVEKGTKRVTNKKTGEKLIARESRKEKTESGEATVYEIRGEKAKAAEPKAGQKQKFTSDSTIVEEGKAYDFEKTGRLKLGSGEELRYVPGGEQVPEGYRRFQDADGETYFINPDTGEMVDESLGRVEEKIDVSLIPSSQRVSTPLKDAQKHRAIQIAQALTAKRGIDTEDAFNFMLERGFVDVDTRQALAEERYYQSDDDAKRQASEIYIRGASVGAPGTPDSPVKGGTDWHSMTRREIRDLEKFAGENKKKREDAVLKLLEEGKEPDQQTLNRLGVNIDDLRNRRYDEFEMSKMKGRVNKEDIDKFSAEFKARGDDDYLAGLKAQKRKGFGGKGIAEEITNYEALRSEKTQAYGGRMVASAIQTQTNDTASADAYRTGASENVRKELASAIESYGSATALVKKREKEVKEELARQERIRQDSTGNAVLEHFKGYTAGLTGAAIEGLGDVAKGVPVWTKPIANYIDSTFGTQARDLKDHPFTQFGQAVKDGGKFIKDFQNADYQKEFWAGSVPQGMGSSLAFMPAALGGPMGIGMFATMQMTGSSYDEAIEAGAKPETAETYAKAVGGLLGWTETLGLGNTWQRLVKGEGGAGVKRILLDALKESGEEVFANELPQTLGQNYLAKITFDPERKWDKDLATSLGAAGVSAPIISTLVSGLLHVKNRRQISRIVQDDMANGGPFVRDFGESGLYVHGKPVKVNADIKPLVEKHRSIQKEIQTGFDDIATAKQRMEVAAEDQKGKYEDILIDIRGEQLRLMLEQQGIAAEIAEKSGIPAPGILTQKEEFEAGATTVELVAQNVPSSEVEKDATPPETRAVAKTETLEPGQTVTLEDGSDGVVVEDRGKSVLVDTKPVEKDGETKYQGRETVRKQKLSIPETNETKTEVSPQPASLDAKPLVQDSSSKDQIPASVSETADVKKPDSKTTAQPEAATPNKPKGPIIAKGSELETKKPADQAIHKFSSTQVNLPPATAKPVIDAGQKLIPESELYTDPTDPSYGREQEPHITVKYGLHTENADEVRKILANEKPFNVKLGKTSIFAADSGGREDKPYDVVKIDVDSPELHRLNKLIADNTDVTDTFPTYEPHVTIAYVKKGQGEKYIGNTAFEGKTIPFNSIAFSSKSGEVVEIPLGGKGDVETKVNRLKIEPPIASQGERVNRLKVEAPIRPATMTGAKARITELEEQRDTARRDSETDPLTGVANRRALDRALPTAEADADTSVIAFDANNFGQINKKVSETEGDKVLKEMATALETAAKEHGGRVFRKGGDEFTILAPKASAEAIRDRAEELFGTKNFDGFDVSVSGVVGNTFPDADANLQKRKKSKKAANLQTANKALSDSKERSKVISNETGRELQQPRQAKGGTYQGKETKIRVPDSKDTYDARYVIREIEDVIPSHNPFNFQPNADYYFTNDRHYDKEKQYQEQVRNRSKGDEFDASQLVNNSPTSETGPPIIDEDGNALGGNSRAMILHRIYKDAGNALASYRSALDEQAAIYGISAEELAKFNKPVLVREISDASIDSQAAITDLNKTSTTALTTAERAVAEAGKMSDEAVDYIAGKIEAAGSDATLTEALNSYGIDIVNKLISEGVFAGGDRNTLIDGGKITTDGKTRIERMLLGRIFDDLEQFEIAPPYVKKNIQRAIAPLVKIQSSEEWNILPETREAIDLLTEFKAKGGDATLEEYAQIPSFVNPQGWSDAAIQIADVLRSNPNSVSRAFKSYAGEFRNAQDGGGLFGASTPDEAFAGAFTGDSVALRSTGQATQTETEAFKKWFGESKMVDANGDPIIAFHGTRREFDTFREDASRANDEGFYGKGFYFTFQSDPEWQKYAKGEAEYYGSTVIPAYLKIENPFDISKLSEYEGVRNSYQGYQSLIFLHNIAQMFPDVAKNITVQKRGEWVNDEAPISEVPITQLPGLFEKYSKELKISDVYDNDKIVYKTAYLPSKKKTDEWTDRDGKEHKYIREDMFGHYNTDLSDIELKQFAIVDAIERYDGIRATLHPEGYMTRNPGITNAIKAKGFDGIVQNMHGDEAVVFNPNQIKSAIGNSGAFDPNDSSILRKIRTEDDVNLLYRALPSAHTEDVLDGMTGGTFNEQGELELTPFDAEMTRRAFGEVETLRTGRDTDQAAFDGVVVDANTLNKMSDAINDWSDALAEAGYTEQQTGTAKTLADNLAKLAKESGDFGIAYVFDASLPEERFHQEDLRSGRTDSQAIELLKQSPLWNDGGVFEQIYPNLSDADKASEIVAKLYTGQESKYGWDKIKNFDGVRKSFFAAWIDGVIRQNADKINTESLETFFESFKQLGKVYAETQTDKNSGRSRSDKTQTGRTGSVQELADGSVSEAEPGGGRESAEASESADSGTAATETADKVKPRKTVLSAEKYGVVDANRITGDVRYYKVKSVDPRKRRAQERIEQIGLDAAVIEAMTPVEVLSDADEKTTLQWETVHLLNDLAEANKHTALAISYSKQAEQIVEVLALQGTGFGQLVQSYDQVRREDARTVVEYVERRRKAEGYTDPLTDEERTKLKEAALALAEQHEKVLAMQARIDELENQKSKPGTKLTKSQRSLLKTLSERSAAALTRINNAALRSIGTVLRSTDEVPPKASLEGQILNDLADIGAAILFDGFYESDVITPEAFETEFNKQTGGKYADEWRRVHAYSVERLKSLRDEVARENAIERIKAENSELMTDAEIDQKVQEDIEKQKEQAKIRREHRKLADEILKAPKREAKRIQEEIDREINRVWKEKEKTLRNETREAKKELEKAFRAQKKTELKFERDIARNNKKRTEQEIVAHQKVIDFLDAAAIANPKASTEVLAMAALIESEPGISTSEASKRLGSMFPDLSPAEGSDNTAIKAKYEEVNTILGKARIVQDRVRKHQNEQAEIARGKTEEALTALADAKRARTESRKSFDALASRLERPPLSATKKVTQLQRMMMVSAINTAVNNMVSGVATRGMQRVVDVFDVGFQKAAKKWGVELASEGLTAETRWMDVLAFPQKGGAKAYLQQMVAAHSTILAGLDEHPELFNDLYGDYSSDIESVDDIKNSKNGVIHKALDGSIYVYDKLNFANRWQEYFVRDLEALYALQTRAGQKGLNLADLEKNGELNKLTLDDWQFAVDRARLVTFSKRPERGTVADKALRVLDKLPVPAVIVAPFAKFSWNAWNLTRSWMPIAAQIRAGRRVISEEGATVRDLFSPTKYTSREMANSMTGFVFLAVAYALVAGLGDRDDWYYLRVPGTDGQGRDGSSLYIDMRQHPQFAPFLYIANKFKRWTNGQDLFNYGGAANIASELSEVFLSLSYRQAVDQNSLIQGIGYGISSQLSEADSQKDKEKAMYLLTKFTGERLGIAFSPARPLKNILDSFATPGDVDLDAAPFTQGFERNLPNAIFKAAGFDTKKDLKGQPKQYNPYAFLKPIGLNVVDDKIAEAQQSQTLRTARKLAFKNAYEPPVLPDEKKEREAKRDIYRLLEELRKVEPSGLSGMEKNNYYMPVYEALTNAVKTNQLSDGQAEFISRGVGMSEVVSRVSRGTVDVGLTIYETSLTDKLIPDKERSEIKNALELKINRSKEVSDDAMKKANRLGIGVVSVLAPKIVSDELERFDIATPNVGSTLRVKGEKSNRKLTNEELIKYKREMLTATYAEIEKLLKSEKYQRWNDERRQKEIKKLITETRNEVKEDVKKGMEKVVP